MLAGSLTALSMLLEQPKRRAELSIYCMPHAARAVWRKAVAQRLLRPPRWLQRHAGVLMFSVAAAVIMATDRRDFSHAFQFLLRLVLGDAAGFHRNNSTKLPSPQARRVSVG